MKANVKTLGACGIGALTFAAAGCGSGMSTSTEARVASDCSAVAQMADPSMPAAMCTTGATAVGGHQSSASPGKTDHLSRLSGRPSGSSNAHLAPGVRPKDWAVGQPDSNGQNTAFSVEPFDVIAPYGSFYSASQSRGINASGLIVGTGSNADPWLGDPSPHGYIRDQQISGNEWDKITELIAPSMHPEETTVETHALGINDAGQVVGYYSTWPESVRHGFVRDAAGTYTRIDHPGARHTSAYGISNAGQVVGTYSDGISERGFVRASDGSFSQIDVPGAEHTWARGINSLGQVAGTFSDGARAYGFVYNGETFTRLDVPGAMTTEASGINDAGQVVGFYVDGQTWQTRSFVYVGGLFTTIDVLGSSWALAYGINSVGQVVGVYHDPASWSGYRHFVATPR